MMSGITASHRFPGELNQDIRKLAVNMVPFPHMHFLLCGVSPMGDCSETTPLDEDILTKNIFASCDARSGKHIATSLIFRGEFHAMEVENQLSRLRSKSSAQFVEWIPDNIKPIFSKFTPPGIGSGVTVIDNNTAVSSLMRQTENQFSALFKRKAFLHWYTMQGMDEMEFTEAQSNAADLINEYPFYEEYEIDDME